jgi:hypothetical protein
MSNIIAMKREVSQDAIDRLESALVDLRSGKVTGVLLVEQGPDGIWYSIAGVEDRLQVLGFLTHAAQCLSARD